MIAAQVMGNDVAVGFGGDRAATSEIERLQAADHLQTPTHFHDDP